MRKALSLAALMPLVMLGACETADQLVGETIDRWSGPAPQRQAAIPAAVPGPVATPAVSATPGGRAAPDGTLAWIRSAEARLVMDLPTLVDGTVTRRRFTSADSRFVEEDAHWTGPGKNPVSAGMLLSEAAAGPPLTDATDPQGPVEHWAVFRERDRSFGELIGSQNVLGPVLWRRSRAGTRTCVAFLQRWAGSRASDPVSTLSGYYCAAPGDTLSPGEAETVVRSLGIQARK